MSTYDDLYGDLEESNATVEIEKVSARARSRGPVDGDDVSRIPREVLVSDDSHIVLRS